MDLPITVPLDEPLEERKSLEQIVSREETFYSQQSSLDSES